MTDPARQVPFARDQSAAVRAAVAEFARSRAVPENRTRDMVTAVHEVVVNAVRFGGGNGVLHLWSEPDHVICEVTDAGSRARAPAFPGHLPPEPRAPRAHGMWVVRQLSDLVTEQFGPEGSAVRMYFRR
ncbi:ATP-binding protein [Streptomyces regalis]|nr:ATP-binding protein [Streptomyces regalis]